MPPADTRFEDPPIVVGVEGSEPDLAATGWAATEAELRQLPLWLVHAYEPHPAWSQHPTRHANPPETILATAANAARTARATVPITCQAHTSPPAQLLIGLSRHASMVVVGHRGRGCGSPLGDLRSAVASAVTAHARGTVAVIRAGLHPAAQPAPVVVGVDGSTASTVALGLAFEEAALRNAPLEVVRALPPEPTAGESADFDTAARELHDWVRHWHDAHPRLSVSAMVAPAHPITALIDASQRASLLVVGARGVGGGQGRPVGSVSQQLVHLAACPVLVVRTPARPTLNVPATRLPTMVDRTSGTDQLEASHTQKGASL